MNLDAIVKLLSNSHGVIYLVCAGTDGVVTGEDCLCAGAIAVELQKQSAEDFVMDDSTRIVAEFYNCIENQKGNGILSEMLASIGGQNLIQRGFEEDIRICSQRSKISVVPEYNHETGKINLLSQV